MLVLDTLIQSPAGVRHPAPLDGEGCARLIEVNYTVFQELLAEAELYFRRRRFQAAAALAQIAGHFAMCQHTGLFVSPRLERLLANIGRATVHRRARWRPRRRQNPPRRVLHVLTQAFGIGGHTRMVWRWLQEDPGREHSIVLTRQGAWKIPEPLCAAVAATGGRIHVLNEQIGDLISWAAMLAELAASASLVVLHTHPNDVLPTIAFADKAGAPPVVFLNHSDHGFWVGASVSDVLVNQRKTGAQLAHARRQIGPERCGLLPIILQPPHVLARPEARRRIGVAADAVLLLSIARPHKYFAFTNEHAQLQQPDFLDGLMPVLERRPQAQLIVIGPDHDPWWEAASQRTGGRVRALGPRADTADFYRAADIYIDSFPLGSNTSMLEAGAYGLPIVSRVAYDGEASVLSGDTPALDQCAIYAGDIATHTAALCKLIDEADYRLREGAATRTQILAVHSGQGWRQFLDQLYAQASAVTPALYSSDSPEPKGASDLDLLWPLVFPAEPTLAEILPIYLTSLPLSLRLRLWLGLVQRDKAFLPGLLLPEWLSTRVERLRYRGGYDPWQRA